MHFTQSAPQHPSAHGDGASASNLEAVPEKNQLLRSLPQESLQRLLPHLEPAELKAKDLIWEPDGPVEWVYFPRTCVMSLLVPLREEISVEAATVGCEGFVGVPIVLGADSTSTRCINQVPGSATRLRAAILRETAEEDRALRTTLLRYAQALHEQTAQSVACNSRHEINE